MGPKKLTFTAYNNILPEYRGNFISSNFRFFGEKVAGRMPTLLAFWGGS
jgi:hypothetical protein